MVKKLYAFFLAGSPWQRLGVLLVLGVALFALLAPFIWPAYAEQDLSRPGTLVPGRTAGARSNSGAV